MKFGLGVITKFVTTNFPQHSRLFIQQSLVTAHIMDKQTNLKSLSLFGQRIRNHRHQESSIKCKANDHNTFRVSPTRQSNISRHSADVFRAQTIFPSNTPIRHTSDPTDEVSGQINTGDIYQKGPHCYCMGRIHKGRREIHLPNRIQK